MKRLLILIVLLLVGAGAAAGFFYRRIHEPYRGFAGAEQFVEIPQGSGTKTIGDVLVASGIVQDQVTFRLALWMSGRARGLKAGEYRFEQPMTPLEVIGKIARGDVYVVRVTFPEGLTIAEMANIFQMHGFGSAADFLEASKDASLIRALDPSARNLEGYLFPETYPLSRHADAAHVVRLMVEQFTHAFTPELQQAAQSRGLSVRQVVTLASLVEKETARPDERPIVAAVYENRMRIGMLLQCDPTVIYALSQLGRYSGNLHHDDLSVDSPYNTYRRAGLPPGPIAAPGKASLEAAVHPADSPFLYFVSRNDGSHEFAQTLEEHDRNVQKYQVQYFRNKRTTADTAGKADGAGRAGRSGRAGEQSKSGKSGRSGRSSKVEKRRS
jgi:peptidoglycan lytic transglycosylase G